MDYIVYIAARALSLIFILIPLRIGLLLGRGAGLLIFYVNHKRRKVAYKNLKAAFGKTKDPGQLMKITKGVYKNFGQMLIEVLRLPAMGKRYTNKFLKIRGMENLKAAQKNGKGVIFLTGHFGNWELSSAVSPLMGLSVISLAREQKHSRLNDLLNEYRQINGARIVSKGASVRELIRHLRSGGIIGMLTDQDAGKFSEFINFFDRPASMHKGAFEFALKTDSTILPAFMIREKGPYHRLEILKPIHIDPRDLDRPLQIKNGMQVFAGILQSFVSRYPEQWLWLHKRWKSTPARTVVVLNDGKAGHLNQSLGVARIIQKYRQDRGYVSGDTKLEVIDVKYKSGFHRFLFSLCGMFASGACQGCMRCVRFCLEPGSAKKLLHAYAYIVISCGSSLAPVNLCLSKENDARSVCIMKPGRLSLKRFSLAVIPKHDGIRPRKNIVVTDGSPNIVDPETMLADSKRMEKLTGSSTRRKIGILLGGNNPDYKMEPDLIKKIADEIEAVAERLDLEIMITTSRRTPRSVDNFLKERFGRSKRCRSLVIANENNVKGAVGGILGLCDVVVVSGDSSSMISEAASSGKHTLVFLLDKRGRKKTKHDALIKNLSRQGCLAVAGPDSMADAVEGLITNGSRGPKGLGDKEKIYKAVGALF